MGNFAQLLTQMAKMASVSPQGSDQVRQLILEWAAQQPELQAAPARKKKGKRPPPAPEAVAPPLEPIRVNPPPEPDPEPAPLGGLPLTGQRVIDAVRLLQVIGPPPSLRDEEDDW